MASCRRKGNNASSAVPLDKRLSRSMENLDEILTNLGAFGNEHKPTKSLTNLSQSDHQNEYHSAMMSHLNTSSDSPSLASLNSSSITSMPPSPSPQDVYVEMLNQDWDVYKQIESGRLFYHNPTTGDTKWKPPRRKKTDAQLPRTENSVFSFGSSRTDEEEIPSSRLSIVRNSLRRSDESVYVPPPGYTEYYDKETGLIRYRDNVNEVTWLTNLDETGQLYFYTDDGKSSAWQLPPVPSILTGTLQGKKTCGVDDSSSDNKTPVIHQLKAVRSGTVRRRVTGYVAGPHQSDNKRSPKKWQSVHLVLSERYLLCFRDELSFRRMGTDVDSLPDLCVDLTQCRLSWIDCSKKRSTGGYVLRLRSSLTGIDLQLQLEQVTEANNWYEELKPFVKEVAPLSQPNTPINTLAIQHYDFDTKLLHPRPISSAPSSPLLSETRKEIKSPLAQGDISLPTNVVKASPEEIRQLLLKGAADLNGDTKQLDKNPFKDKNVHRVGRSRGLSKSFRKMADAVHLRPKSPSAGTRLVRVLSRRSIKISNMLDRRQSKEDLVKKGIIKPEAVFGNYLLNTPHDEATGLPEFLVRCARRIESMIGVVGIYRINGDAALVQKLRFQIDKDEYKTLDSTNDVSLLASAMKLFFRELPDPMISKAVRDFMYQTVCTEKNEAKRLESLRKGVHQMDEFSSAVLHYLLLHLRRVANEPANMMTPKSLATVFSPNLVHSAVTTRRPESIMSEMELNSHILELLIEHVEKIFTESKTPFQK